jgi:hypothetical protein
MTTQPASDIQSVPDVGNNLQGGTSRMTRISHKMLVEEPEGVRPLG